MRWLAKYTIVDPVDGDMRVLRVFAWLPHYIGGVIVWVEKYEILQVYRINEEKVEIDNQKTTLLAGRWVNLSDRCKK